MAIRIRKQPNRQITTNLSRTPDELIEVARQNGLQTTPLDLIGLCRIWGINVKLVPLENNLSGRLQHDGTRWTILANALHHERRQRFTIAHELAHYFLHRSPQDEYEDITFHRGQDYNSRELEADNFAGALLMPKADFTNFINGTSNKIDDIAEFFGTSGVAVKKRADVIRSRGYEF